MKKKIILLITIMLFVFTLASCNKNNELEKSIENALSKIELPKEVKEDLDLVKSVDGFNIIWESSNENAISSDGKITRSNVNIEVVLKACISEDDITKEKEFKVTILKMSTEEVILDALNKISVPSLLEDATDIPESVDNFTIYWSYSKEDLFKEDGSLNKTLEEVQVTLTASITHEGVTLNKEFNTSISKLSKEEALIKAFEEISLPSETEENITLPTHALGLVISWTTTDKNHLTNKGVVKRDSIDVLVTLKATISYEGITKTKEYTVNVKADPILKQIDEVATNVDIPTETYVDIVLPKSIGDIEITWSSSRISSLTKDGIVNRSEEDVTVLLTGTFAYNGIRVQKYFDIVIKGWTDKEKVEKVINDINFNDDLSFDLILSDSLGYGTNAEWLSSNTNVLTNDGKYTYDENVSTITLKVTVSLGSESMSKEFILNVMPKEEAKKDHLVIKRAESFESSKFNNVELKDGVLVLSAGFTEGSYESETIETLSFTSLVASWAAVSSTTSTVELFVSARVNGVWSDYISYKEWGLGLQNACYDQTNSLIKLSTDEVMVLNSKKADAIKFKVVLRTTTNTTPKLSLVSFALEVPGYTYPVDISKYPTSVIHSVPKLYQQVVPTIGNSICSATSSTMLLKYKGEDFSSFDSEYEHRYIAGIVRDYGNKIYGNWVYNTVAMSAYGYDSYVARFYSINELVEHLATVGPCALSVKGQMNSDKKNYYTNGHLIVAIGYEIDTNGNITIVCNDPNVSSVECRYSLTVMNNTWRNIAYVIE